MLKQESYVKTETIFPLIIAGMSMFTISSNLYHLLSLKVLVSVIGLVGTVLYFKKNRHFNKLIYIWIAAQTIIITKFSVNDITGTRDVLFRWDLTQSLKLNYGIYFTKEDSYLFISFNFISILFFALFKILQISGIVGKQLTFSKFREDNRLGDIFPLTGTVLKRVTLAKEKEWLLVELSAPFLYDDKPINHVLVKSKSEGAIKTKIKNQLVYFRLVENIDDIEVGNNDINHFPFIDWAFCK